MRAERICSELDAIEAGERRFATVAIMSAVALIIALVMLWPGAAGAGERAGRSFAGMASFYGNESGSRTASGQRFNQNAMTCAHRSLPFGTRLRVTYRGQAVVVTVNDRGPFVRGRVLDLSRGAARAIGLTGAGVGRVLVEVVS